MARDLTGAMATEVAAPSKRPVIFYEGVFADGTLRLCSLPYTVNWNGESWLGAGNLLGFSQIEESTEVRASGCSVSLVASPAIAQLALAQSRSGQSGKVWLGAKGDEVVESGTAQAGASSSLTLAADASGSDDAYNRMTLSLTSGAGSVQERVISDYDGATQVATVSPNWQATYADLPGAAGNNVSTPDAAVLDIVGDIDIRIRVASDDWTPAALTVLVEKWVATGNQRSWALRLNTNGTLNLLTTVAGDATSVAGTSTVAPVIADGAPIWLRVTLDVDNGAGSRVYNFYTSADGETWDQLGSTVTTAGTTSIFSGTAPIRVGSGFTPNPGNYYRFQLFNGIAGTLVADFNAADARLGDSTVVSSTTGETWTVNTSGGSPAVLAPAPDNTTAYEVINPDGIIADPFLAFEGRLDVPRIQKGERPVISIAYESRLRDLERPREERITHEEQQRLFPGDKGREYVAELQDKTVTF